MKNILLSLRCDADADAINAEHDRAEARRVGMMMFFDADVPKRHFPIPAILPGPWADKLKDLEGQVGKGCLLALLGKRGTGKTQMAVELIRITCVQGRSARYTTALRFFMSLKDSYRVGTTESAVLNKYLKPHLLVIDEAQERGETGWEDRLLGSLVDSRYGAMRDTVLVSNLSRREFERAIGSSIMSRMSETGGIIECNWPSFRDTSKHGPDAAAGVKQKQEGGV